MSDELVTVASFSTPGEAQIARNMLEAEGITALLADEESVGMAWYLGNALGGVKVLVPKQQWMRAKVALAHHLEDFADDDEDVDAAEESDAHITEKPAHAEKVTEQRIVAKPKRVAAPEAGMEEPEPMEVVSEGEELAGRAFRAALVGIPLPFLLIFHGYSLWLLLKLLCWDGDLSGKASLKALLALVIDVTVLIALALLILIRI